ncbi:hypothetical protein T08_15140 [Trichinella sp. T8]|nr:hypothetical protein T08_15140 [Trichinella sp. T8]
MLVLLIGYEPCFLFRQIFLEQIKYATSTESNNISWTAHSGERNPTKRAARQLFTRNEYVKTILTCSQLICPHTLISSETHDMLPLSLAHFLIGRSLSSITDESEKHRHEALNASKGSPDEHCLHSLDTMAERVRHDDKDTTSDCSRKVLIANCSIITFLMSFKWYCAMWKPQSTTVPLRLSPVRLTTCSRYLWPISLLGGACRQLRTKWQSEKHRHEALNASKGSPDEHCLHSLDTMAERVRHDDKDTTSDCSRKVLIAELESIICAADLTELLNYYISDELQMVLCDVEAPINDCPLTLIFSGTQDKLALTAAQGLSRSVALFTYCWLNSLFYCALYLLSY